MSLEVRPETFESLEAEWRALAQRSRSVPVFVTPAWQKAWWTTCRGPEEMALLAFREGGRLCGIAPLMRSEDHVRFVAYSDLCDHHEFVIEPGCEAVFYLALLDAAESAGWSKLVLDGLVEDSPTLKLLPEFARQHGWQVEREPDGVSPAKGLSATWEEYLQGLGGKDRHELRRKMRRLASAGDIRFHQVTEREDLASQMPTFLDLLKASREEKAQFMTPVREQFFHRVAEAMASEGLLRLFFMELDAVKVAASLCFDYGGAYYLYNSGYNTKYASLSVGLLLKAMCVQDAIEGGRSHFHFLRGAEGYKYDLGGEDMHLYRIQLQR